MPVPSPAEAARRWRQNISAAGETIKQGVQAVTESPTEKAAQRIDSMIAGIQQAAMEGRIQEGLRRVSLSDWKQAMTDKAIPRISASAASGASKYERYAQQAFPQIQAIRDSLPPRGSFEQNMQRAREMAEKLHQMKGKMKVR